MQVELTALSYQGQTFVKRQQEEEEEVAVTSSTSALLNPLLILPVRQLKRLMKNELKSSKWKRFLQPLVSHFSNTQYQHFVVANDIKQHTLLLQDEETKKNEEEEVEEEESEDVQFTLPVSFYRRRFIIAEYQRLGMENMLILDPSL
jgi:hypothetical protein